MKRFSASVQEAKDADCIIDAMSLVYQRANEQRTLANFNHLLGIDVMILEALPEVAERAFGRRFKGISNFGKPLYIFIHPSRRDSTKLDLTVDFQVEYGGFFDKFDGPHNAGNFNRVFSNIANTMRDFIKIHFRGVEVFMTHSYCRNRKMDLTLTVQVEPLLQQEAA